MDKADLVVHIIELIVAIIVVPAIKQLITTLVNLTQNVALLSQRLEQHALAFERHVDEDRDNFKALHEALAWGRRDADRHP